MKLEEILGTMLSSVSKARLSSDVESMKIANIYSKDRIMKNLSIPRLKIKDVEISLPLAFESGCYNLSGKIQKIESKFILNSISEIFKVDKNAIIEGSKKLTTEINEYLHQNKNTEGLSIIIKNNVILMKEILSSREKLSNLQLDSNIKLLSNRISSKIFNENKIFDLANINFIATSEDLQKLRVEDLIRVKINIYEESIEWIIHESNDGNKTEFLQIE